MIVVELSQILVFPTRLLGLCLSALLLWGQISVACEQTGSQQKDVPAVPQSQDSSSSILKTNWQALIKFVCNDCPNPVTYRSYKIPIQDEIFSDASIPGIELTGSPEVVRLSKIGNIKILDELVKLLDDPQRAFAANVVLHRMVLGSDSGVFFYENYRNKYSKQEIYGDNAKIDSDEW